MKKPARKIKSRRRPALVTRSVGVSAQAASFREVVAMIESARTRAYHAVNNELIELYWRIGGFISRKITAAGWGKSTVASLSAFIRRNSPTTRGYSPQNLWRMRQFYETWQGEKNL